MPQASGITVENNFTKGLITEGSGLSFPEDACTDTYNCIFSITGSVNRRPGFDFEDLYNVKTINRDNSAIRDFLWKNVSGNGDVTLYVVQIGATIYFYNTSSTIGSTSAGALSTTVSLSSFLAAGAPIPDFTECQFTSGPKYLIVTHPYCDPFYISFDTGSNTATGHLISLLIRDTEGDTADVYINDQVGVRPGSLSIAHHYNLLNQGWTDTNITAFTTYASTYPSNSDLMQEFKNTSDVFDAATVPNAFVGNSQAGRGHYILSAFNTDRNSIVAGATSSNTSYLRPTTCSWFAGRVFYSGINYPGYNSKIFFSQIVENDKQSGNCYQSNDPTAEDLNTLLPSDGGTFSIPEAGTIVKLFPVSGALIVFATNGIWIVTGSTGLGFRADDFVVQKVATLYSISPTSFVDVKGMPMWWTADGIYALTSDNSKGMVAQNLTLTTIKTFYDDIPLQSKLSARGYYSPLESVVRWLFKSTAATTPSETYEFDRVLNLNMLTGAFYPWTISDSNVKVNSIMLLEGSQSLLVANDIVDDAADTIIDDGGDTLLMYTTASNGQAVEPTFKYLVSYPDGAGSYLFTFAEANNNSYLDWRIYDGLGIDYESYFISGYRTHGKAITKYQATWVEVYSQTFGTTSEYGFQGVWDFALTTDTGKFTNTRQVTNRPSGFGVAGNKIKVRGRGKTLQFKITSTSGTPFSIIGWVAFETGNQLP